MAKQEQSRSKRGVSRRAAINVNELRRSLKELKGEGPSEVEVAERAMRRDMRALRRSVAKRLEPLVADGIDVDKARAILADYEHKQTRLLKRSKSAVDRALSAAVKKQALADGGRRKALEILAAPSLPFAPTSIVLKPILIWAKSDRPRSNILKNSHADPIGLSWAQVAMETSELPPEGDETFRLEFWYLWSNDRDYYEVVNANCLMVLNGTCTVRANTGIFDGGKSSVNCSVFLSPLEWWNQPPTLPNPSQPSRWWYAFNVKADAGGFLSFGDIDGVTLSGVSHELRYDLFVIPPGAAAVFKVEVLFYCSVDDGSIDIDFASTPNYAYSIGCQLQLELLTAPGVVGPISPGRPVVFG